MIPILCLREPNNTNLLLLKLKMPVKTKYQIHYNTARIQEVFYPLYCCSPSLAGIHRRVFGLHSSGDIKNSVASLVGDFFCYLKEKLPKHHSTHNFMMFCVLQSHCDMHVFLVVPSKQTG